MAIDSIVQLALMSKAKKVFEKEGTFLSFPVTPLAYTKEDLDFFSQETGSDLLQSKANLSAFSTLVNLIPHDEVWLPTDARFLWNELEYVLREGTLASSTRTPEEEVAYQEALTVLKVPGEGGLLQDSPKVRVYNQYKDAYIMTEQEYMEARSTGETTEDETEKKRWREIDEPAFRAKLKDLDNQWILEGYKNEVNIARSQYQNLGAKSPTITWDEWKGCFNQDLDSETNAQDNFTVFPSSFTPSNALEEGSWNPFSLSETEIKALVNEAPADLRKRFSADGKVSSMKSVTLEFSSAAIKRSWFDSEIFRARFWRLSDANKVFSDGGNPPSGDCPAYVTAIVFARKVVVEEKQSQPTSSNPKMSVDLRFNYAVKDQHSIKRINPAVLQAVQPQLMKRPSIPPQRMKAKPVRPLMMKMRPQAMASFKSTAIRVPAQPTRGNVLLKPAVMTPMVARPAFSRSMVNLKASAYTRFPTRPVRKPAPRPATPPSPTADVPDNSIYILAFICKPLPKCPDPDMTLQW
ncbi:MAG: hypothetical protein NPIRA03_25950 [Nitrospirales bacterium]|nr:MAG: hypothetical protein NPIRA03_25950 [Nitrospirales bacterium]